MPMTNAPDPLALFSEPTRSWFREAFAQPTRAQTLGWPAIAGGEHTLLHAPTGSGKTLAAFLWTLDTPADARRQLTRDPPDILVTTPESLYLVLTSQAREALRGVEHVIVDEVHAIAGTKRGAHLALSLERLSALTAEDPQRIGLSATQRPLEAIAAFLGGAGREVTIVDAGARKELDLEVVVPVEDMSRMGDVLELDETPGGPA